MWRHSAPPDLFFFGVGQLLLFQSLIFNLLDKLIKQALKDDTKLGKTTLKQMLEFEQKFIA